MSVHSDQQNNGFGPISRKRGKKSTIMAWIILALFIGLRILYLKVWQAKESIKWSSEVIVVAVSIAGAVFGELIRRFCLFYEEYGHIETRHRGKFAKAFKACFYPGDWKLLCIIMGGCVTVAAGTWQTYKTSFNIKNTEIFLMNIIFVPLFSFVIGLRTSTHAEVSEKNENESKNVADGLAWSFYFGYLKLILPKLEETLSLTDKEVDGVSLCDHIEDQKIFIIIPKNCYCYTSFQEIDPRIQFIDCTHPLEINRAGVQRRVYKNSVYKITAKNGKAFYCIMEYATPLMSLYDMGEQANSGLDAVEREEQVVLFFKKLKEILENDPACRGKYHIVLTSDARDQLADTMAREIMGARNATFVTS